LKSEKNVKYVRYPRTLSYTVMSTGITAVWSRTVCLCALL